MPMNPFMSVNPESDDFARYLDSLNRGAPNMSSEAPLARPPVVVNSPVLGPPSSLASPQVPQAPPADQEDDSDVSTTVKNAISKKYGYPEGMDSDALAQAQSQQNQSNFLAQIGKAGAQIGAGIARVNTPKTPVFEDIEKNAGVPVQQVMDQRKAFQDNLAFKQQEENNDPDSPKAAIWRNALKDLAEQVGLSSDDLDVMNLNDLQTFAKGPAEFAAKLKEQQNLKEIQLAQIKASKEIALDQKKTQQQNQAMQQTSMLLESARGNPAVGQAETNLLNAAKIKSLANLYGDPNKLSPQQQRLLVSELAKVATGGQATEGELKALDSGTLEGKIAEAWGKVSNEPKPANAGEFIKGYLDYTNALEKDSKKVIEDKYGRVIESRKQQLGDDNYNSLKSQYTDRFKMPEGTSNAAKTVSKDVFADYVTSHKTTPQAAKAFLESKGYVIEQ